MDTWCYSWRFLEKLIFCHCYICLYPLVLLSCPNCLSHQWGAVFQFNQPHCLSDYSWPFFDMCSSCLARVNLHMISLKGLYSDISVLPVLAFQSCSPFPLLVFTVVMLNEWDLLCQTQLSSTLEPCPIYLLRILQHIRKTNFKLSELQKQTLQVSQSKVDSIIFSNHKKSLVDKTNFYFWKSTHYKWQKWTLQILYTEKLDNTSLSSRKKIALSIS